MESMAYLMWCTWGFVCLITIAAVFAGAIGLAAWLFFKRYE